MKPITFGMSPTRSLGQHVVVRRHGFTLPKSRERHRAFTLIELLIVITIIAVLLGLLFPAFQGVQDRARKTQAKNDLAQIITAVNAFYTEFGTYPSLFAPEMTFDAKNGNDTDKLFNELRGNQYAALNTRQISFVSFPSVKDDNQPKGGFASNGRLYDPWGTQYVVRLDTDYDNKISNPYSKNAGATPQIDAGVIAWSFGPDAKSQSTSAQVDKKSGTNADDVLSWQ
ncbi:MAG TPA: prepilin-type N-terminal cleavage/methylation domain-containing protein [Chthoniobacterales bacterium]|jgi:prepilin-type N-terminal cleavage/methylation domain-containing protein